MLYVVIAFLWASICLYLILGGADFGAGIIELMSGRKNSPQVRKIMYKAIGPVWEANHMWLIIAIVILFVGFPEIYTTMSIYMHIPLVGMLLGIIARGTSFVFRNYDAVEDNMQRVYTPIFMLASLVTPFFLGTLAAATVSGSIDTAAQNFADAYIFSWLNWFGISTGCFTVAICGYLAAVFATGQAPDEAGRKMLIRKSRHFIVAVLLCGAFVFMAAWQAGIPLLNWIFGHWIGQTAIVLATLSVFVLLWGLKSRKFLLIRLMAGFQVLMILLAATYRHYPNIILFKNGSTLSLLQHAGDEKTISTLAWALLLGSIFILPFLAYLIYIFNKPAQPNHSDE